MNRFFCLMAWWVIAVFLAVSLYAQEEPSGTPQEQEPAVAAILATKPSTPAECLRAAKMLVDLGHPDVAKPLVQKLIEAKLGPKELADLGDEFGLPMFLDLAGQAELLPEARQLADAVAEVMKARQEDVGRIVERIAQLQDDSEEKRLAALAKLQDAGEAAIGPMISVLADPARGAEHENVRTVLAGMGLSARQALAATLDAADPKLQAQAILTLVEMNASRSAIDLFVPALSEKSDPQVREVAVKALKQWSGRVPTAAEAVKLLTETAKSYFEKRQPLEGEDGEVVAIWRWNDEKRQCEAKLGTPADAARALADRYARQAFLLAPQNPKVRLLHLTAMLDHAAYANGLDKPLDEKQPAVVEAETFGPEALDRALVYAMETQHPAAGTAAVRLLGRIGKADALLQQGDRPAPLALALLSPDRRLRMAALHAIVRLQPTKPYAGSSYVLPALGYFASSSGTRKVLVGGPNLEQSRTLAGMLAAEGYQADTAASGKELLLMATESPDYELAMIDVGIERPGIDSLMQSLRRDHRTALLRVGLVARAGHDQRAERVARNDPMSDVFARPHDDEAVRWQLEQLAENDPQEFVPFVVRQQQAAEAMDLLLELFQSSNPLYDLRREEDAVLLALYHPKLSEKAIAILANMNSATSQQALVDAASRATLPLATRQAAAKAFRENTQKFGILLTSDAIRRQYDRYNESEKLDAPTQGVLGLILDCLEAPTKVENGEE